GHARDGGEPHRAGAVGAGAGGQGVNENRSIRTPQELVAAGLLPPDQQGEVEAVAARYAIAVTPAMAELIDRDDPADPIAKQFVPNAAELVVLPQELADPIGDA